MTVREVQRLNKLLAQAMLINFLYKLRIRGGR